MTIIIPTPLYALALLGYTIIVMGITFVLTAIALSEDIPDPPKEPLTSEEKRKLKKLAEIDERWR